LASRFKNITTFLLIAVVLPPVVGSAIIFSVKTKGVRLFAYYCVSYESLQMKHYLLTLSSFKQVPPVSLSPSDCSRPTIKA
jgi:hypothetical protein